MTLLTNKNELLGWTWVRCFPGIVLSFYSYLLLKVFEQCFSNHLHYLSIVATKFCRAGLGLGLDEENVMLNSNLIHTLPLFIYNQLEFNVTPKKRT